MTRTYRIGHQYRDAGKKGAGDEFMDWLNTKIPDSQQEKDYRCVFPGISKQSN